MANLNEEVRKVFLHIYPLLPRQQEYVPRLARPVKNLSSALVRLVLRVVRDSSATLGRCSSCLIVQLATEGETSKIPEAALNFWRG
ncbi:MAG: hypothetical protein KGL58_02970 [Pseudomonadota bacterium]|nr:hypothetical protein [Pseudomonadota bacterium]